MTNGLLFLCVANSSRSQMAAVIAREPAGHVEGEEASLEPFRGVRDELRHGLSTWLSEGGVTPTAEARP